MWLVYKQKILVRTNLSKRGWEGSVKCEFCEANESINHLFFECPNISRIWVWITTNFNIPEIPGNFSNFYRIVNDQSNAVIEPMIIVCAALMWICWLNRNECCFQQGKKLSTEVFCAKIKTLILY